MKRLHDPFAKARKTAALVKAASVTIDEAVRVAVSNVTGTVVDVKLKEKNERVVWRIKLLTAKGRVKVHIDGRSGKLLEALAETASPASDDMLSLEPVASSRQPSLESATL